MRLFILAVSAVLLMLGGGMAAQAHHSFAVHFVPDEEVDVTGVVTEFKFANPHGVVHFDVTDENGETVTWKGETNSPNLLRRRGWTPRSLEKGEKITVHGWPARDGKPMMRVGYIIKEDGSRLIGQSSAEGISAD